MAPLTNERNTRVLATAERGLPVAAGAVILKGALVVMDGAVAKPGFTGLNLRSVGRALASVDNTDGVDGAMKVIVRSDIAAYNNDPDDPVNEAHIGLPCYITDDQTVSASDGGGTKSEAGKVFSIENGVFVDFT